MARSIIILLMGALAPFILKAQNLKRSIPGSDTVIAVASDKYKDATFFRRLMIGGNYREVWSAEVKMPVFRLSKSDMKIIELGGGQQTKSLKLEDKKGREWALRTVDKEVSGAMPQALRGTLAQKVVQDIISGAYPYAPLIVAHLAKAVEIVAPDPDLYFVPHDAGLGKYQDVFTGKVCYLEEREPARKGTKEVASTSEVHEEIIDDNDHLIMQREVLKARLLDMLIADWDRHADQWRWGEVDSTRAKYFYAIPRDRDQAFFMANGLIPKLGKLIAMHHINWFKPKTKGLRQLNYKSWEFDQVFLNDLDAAEWERTLTEFTSKLTDRVVADAVKRLPPEIYAISGKEIEKILQSRVGNMKSDVMKYYKFLSQIVQVNGSEENEIFRISGQNGFITVSVFRQGAPGSKEIKIYERTFKEKETFLINLIGYGGVDKFIIDQSVSSKIRIGMYGGSGNDEYHLKGFIKSNIFECRDEDNKFIAKVNSKLKYY